MRGVAGAQILPELREREHGDHFEELQEARLLMQRWVPGTNMDSMVSISRSRMSADS